MTEGATSTIAEGRQEELQQQGSLTAGPKEVQARQVPEIIRGHSKRMLKEQEGPQAALPPGHLPQVLRAGVAVQLQVLREVQGLIIRVVAQQGLEVAQQPPTGHQVVLRGQVVVVPALIIPEALLVAIHPDLIIQVDPLPAIEAHRPGPRRAHQGVEAHSVHRVVGVQAEDQQVLPDLARVVVPVHEEVEVEVNQSNA